MAVEVLRAWARNKLMARLMGRGSAAARLRDMGRGSAGENLRGKGSAGVRLRGLGRSSVGARLRGMSRGSAEAWLRGMARGSPGARLRDMGSRVGRLYVMSPDLYPTSGNSIIYHFNKICKVSYKSNKFYP